MASASHADEPPDEGTPLPLEEHEAPVFAQVKVVDVQRGEGWAQDTAWHPEMQAGMACPQCRRYKLKRHHSTVYCWSCKQRWWSKQRC
jgi:hypothetical protein